MTSRAISVATTDPERPNLASLAESADRQRMIDRFRQVRQASIDMCTPLEPEDFRAQPIPEVSPPWWNLGHTSWFFARNVLRPVGGEYLREDEQFDFALNSYYVSLGARLDRGKRGTLTRPTTAEVYRYRASVDERIERLILQSPLAKWDSLLSLLTIGLEHEQQHQELFYTEIKYILAQNPPGLRRPYRPAAQPPTSVRIETASMEFVSGGLVELGNREADWCWDNEVPVHKFYLEGFRLQNRLVTCGEFLQFVEDGGYRQPLLWFDNGWSWCEREDWTAPLYWDDSSGDWKIWTLSGLRDLDPAEPICHVSFYEADAFARWKAQNFREFRGARLPTEREWEHAARIGRIDASEGNFLESGHLHPAPCKPGCGLRQMLGDVWEWTASHYEPYPGYRPFSGVLAEYNGKFMDNQRVLRGGSCVSPRDHLRISYRNFWSPETRFQFTGFRLAQDTVGDA